MKYLTVGTNEIKRDLFRKVEDTDLVNSMKPRGGMWFTEYDKNIKNYNSWVDFMMARPNILFYKNRGSNPLIQPCSIVTLNSDVNIYALHNGPTLDYLLKCFPYKDKFSYEMLSRYYDGIYVNLGSLYCSNYDSNVISKFSSFDVSSLILFNSDCINYYQSGNINIKLYYNREYSRMFGAKGNDRIECFNLDDFDYCDTSYEIKIDDCKKRVLRR